MLHSYELLARYVMPTFQQTTLSTAGSNRWARERLDVLLGSRNRAIDLAKQTYAQRKADQPPQQ